MRLFLCPSELLLDGGELWAAEEIQAGETATNNSGLLSMDIGEMV